MPRVKFFKEFKKKSFLLFLFLVFVFLFIEFNYFEIPFFSVFQRNFFLFLALQIDFILILLLLYFIFRYLFKIFWQLNIKQVSKSLKFKLFSTYLLSILFPSLVLTMGSFFFLKKSVDYWFREFLEDKIVANFMTIEDYYRDIERELMAKGHKIIDEYISKTKRIRSRYLREHYRYFSDLDSIEVYSYKGDPEEKTYSLDSLRNLGIPPSILEKIKKEGTPQSQISILGDKTLVRVFIPTKDRYGRPWILAVGKLLDFDEINAYKKGAEKRFYKIFNAFLILSLALILLLIVFIGVWVGSKIARNLTEPLQGLILATQKISRKDYQIEGISSTPLTNDEIGILVKSFKEMVQKIKQYEEEMQQYNEYLRSILNHLPVGIVILGLDNKVEYVNKMMEEFLKLLGFSEIEELLKELEVQRIISSLKLQETVYKNYRLSRNGSSFYIGLFASKIKIFKGEAYFLIFENLEEKENLKKLSIWKDVATRVAHEIKNPLTPIQLSIQRLRRKLEPYLEESQREILYKTTRTIENYVEELRRLASDFYYFSRKSEPKFRKISLKENIKEAVSLYELSYPEVKFLMEGEDIICVADPFQLKRVWINLIDNAVKAMNGEGRVKISLFKENNRAIVVVEDEGEGLPDELMEKLKKGDIMELKEAGTGLIMVYSIVRLHGGEIEVEKPAEKGTRFIVKLPCGEGEALQG